MGTAILFPGQGSQTSNMRDAVQDKAPELLERCVELVGEDPFQRVEDSTRFQQPAIFCASIVGWRGAAAHVEPDAMAGHSLGELAALAAGGAVAEDDALQLVVTRGALMAEAADAQGEGAMLAVLKGTPEQAHELAEAHGVHVANDNAPGQVVLSGTRSALDEVIEPAKEQGLRTMWLAVAGAFHSPDMKEAATRFRAALDEVEFVKPDVEVLSCATAAPFEDPAAQLADALVEPVRWRQTMQALDERGIERYVDAGPGNTLAQLVARNLDNAQAERAEDLHGAAAA
jgi:malonyl CoA-acyl carrier protein transacylase